MDQFNSRILQLIDTLDPGGAERMAVNLANEFGAKKIPNLLVVSRHYGALYDQVLDKSQVVLLGKKSTLDWTAFRKLLGQVSQFNPQIIHAHGTSIYWGIILKWFRPALKLIWHDHLGISREVMDTNPRRELSVLGRKIDFILTANESTADFWKQKKIIPSQSIKYLPNFPYLNPVPKKDNEIFTFLHLANFRSEKGHLFLLESSRILAQSGLKFKVRMVGKEVDSSWKQKVIEKRNEFGLESTVSIEEEANEIALLFAQVQAGLVVSEREGLPVALLEYGLGSLPVISTRVGQCPAVLNEGKFGKLVPFGDPEALANSMREMLLNPENSEKLGVSFRRHVESRYGPGQFLSAYFDILEQLNFTRK